LQVPLIDADWNFAVTISLQSRFVIGITRIGVDAAIARMFPPNPAKRKTSRRSSRRNRRRNSRRKRRRKRSKSGKSKRMKEREERRREKEKEESKRAEQVFFARHLALGGVGGHHVVKIACFSTRIA